MYLISSRPARIFWDNPQDPGDELFSRGGGMLILAGNPPLSDNCVACCINVWIRMKADQLEIPVGAISVNVSLKRDHPEQAIFQYEVKIEGPLSQDQRATLMEAADDCPVRRTLLKKLLFQRQVT